MKAKAQYRLQPRAKEKHQKAKCNYDKIITEIFHTQTSNEQVIILDQAEKNKTIVSAEEDINYRGSNFVLKTKKEKEKDIASPSSKKGEDPHPPRKNIPSSDKRMTIDLNLNKKLEYYRIFQSALASASVSSTVKKNIQQFKNQNKPPYVLSSNDPTCCPRSPSKKFSNNNKNSLQTKRISQFSTLNTTTGISTSQGIPLKKKSNISLKKNLIPQHNGKKTQGSPNVNCMSSEEDSNKKTIDHIPRGLSTKKELSKIDDSSICSSPRLVFNRSASEKNFNKDERKEYIASLAKNRVIHFNLVPTVKTTLYDEAMYTPNLRLSCADTSSNGSSMISLSENGYTRYKSLYEARDKKLSSKHNLQNSTEDSHGSDGRQVGDFDQVNKNLNEICLGLSMGSEHHKPFDESPKICLIPHSVSSEKLLTRIRSKLKLGGTLT